ncbi:MAG: transposase [Methanosarcinales archaeon]
MIGKYSDQLLRECRETLQKKGGRPKIGEVVMMKILILQQWYGLSDPEIERQIADRIYLSASSSVFLKVFQIIQLCGGKG